MTFKNLKTRKNRESIQYNKTQSPNQRHMLMKVMISTKTEDPIRKNSLQVPRM